MQRFTILTDASLAAEALQECRAAAGEFAATLGEATG